MRLGRISRLLASAAIVLTACGVEPPTTDEPVVEPAVTPITELFAPGEEVYLTTCSPCHGADGEGVAGLGSSLIEGEILTISDEAMRQLITEGEDATDPGNTMGVAMPAKGGNPRLTDEQIDDVVGYLRALAR